MRKQRLRKQMIYLLLIVGAMVFFYCTITFQMPALQKRAFLFMFLLLGDCYVWYSIVKTLSLFSRDDQKTKGKKIAEYGLALFYWFPAALMSILFIILDIKGVTGLFGTPFYTWFGVANTLYLIKFPLFVLIILYNMITFLIKLFTGKKEKIKARINAGRKWLFGICCGIFVIFLGLMLFGMFYGVKNLQVKEVHIRSSHPAFEHHPLKVVQISDLHLISCDKREIEKVVKTVNAQNPDYVFVTGDIVTYSSLEMVPFLPVLKEIKAKYGIFSVLGNHDYGRYASFDNEDLRKQDAQQLIHFQRDLGWNVLLNESVKVPVFETDSVVIAGVEYWSKSIHFFKVGDIDKTFKNVSDSDYVIFLAHDPQAWEEVITRNLPADLTLSGHTHGMQLGINYSKGRWSPASLLYKEWAGLYQNDTNKTRYLYVNLGIGTAGMPVRVGMYPEITVFVIDKN